MNINEIILKSKHYETVEVYRYSFTQDEMGRDVKTLSLIGTYVCSIQPTGSLSGVKGRTLENGHAGEDIKEVWVMYSPIIDIKNTDLVKRLDEGLFYEVRNIEKRKMKPTLEKNGNILDLSHIKTYISRSDNQ